MVKNSRLIAERYAQALSAAVPDNAELARVREDLGALAAAAEAVPDLGRALSSPVVDPAAKLRVVRALAEKGGARPTTVRFLEVLAAHDRLAIFGEIVDAVGRAIDRRLGVVEAEVRTAVPLEAGTRERLVRILERLSRTRVRIKEVVDPDLVGGLVVQVGGTVYDGSLKTQLADLRSRLVGETAGAIG